MQAGEQQCIMGGCVISFNRIVYMYDTAGGVVLHKVGDSGYQVLDKTEE